MASEYTPAQRLRAIQYWLCENVFMVAEWDSDDVDWLESHLDLIGQLQSTG